MKFIPNVEIVVEYYHVHSLSMILSIIYKISDKFLIVVDNSEKIEDVSKMPSYIQDDYLKATSRPLIEEDIDNLIKVVDGQFRKNTITDQNDYFSEKLQKLKNLKREFRIKNLLS
jgi:aminoglycoside phosphotransferase family enzyme